MNNKIVIGLIGEQASGKGTVAKAIINKYHAEKFRTSAILEKILDTLNLEHTRSNFINLVQAIKYKFPNDILMQILIKDVKQSKAKICLVDGIRMLGDVEPFKKEFKNNFFLIFITADIKIRYKRSKLRGEKKGETTASFAKFKKQENSFTEKEIKQVAKKADFVIVNDSSLKKLIEQVDYVMNKIKLS